MSTQTLPLSLSQKRAASDRRFYLVMALAAEAVIAIGFSRTYYLRLHFAQSHPISLLVHVHGFIFTAWMLYFIAQTALIAVERPALHRRLGLTGAFLGSAVIIVGLIVTVVGMRLGHAAPRQDPETIFLIGLIDICSFTIFFILGYLQRRDREAHQRLMLLAVIVGLTGAALGRLLPLGIPIPAVSAINFALLFAGPIYDLITRKSIHPVYRWGVAYALVTFTPLRFLVGATPWWHHIAHTLVGN